MRKNYLQALPREWRTVSRAFTALGDEHRQRILLTFEPGERLNVGQIVEVSTLSRSAVSHHLKLLKTSGVLQSR
jgi:DNA-binding transcriptional ArsR family regulator